MNKIKNIAEVNEFFCTFATCNFLLEETVL